VGHVLVLNASYEPLNITSWRRAVVMVLKGPELASVNPVRPGPIDEFTSPHPSLPCCCHAYS